MKKAFKKIILSSTITSVLLQPLSAYAWFGSSVALPNQLPFSNGTHPLMPANAVLHATLAPGYKPFDEKWDGSLWRNDPAALFGAQGGATRLRNENAFFKKQVRSVLEAGLRAVIPGSKNRAFTMVPHFNNYAAFSSLKHWISFAENVRTPIAIADAALSQLLTNPKDLPQNFLVKDPGDNLFSVTFFKELGPDRKVHVDINHYDFQITTWHQGKPIVLYLNSRHDYTKNTKYVFVKDNDNCYVALEGSLRGLSKDVIDLHPEIELSDQSAFAREREDLQARAQGAHGRTLKRIAALMAREDAHKRLVETDPAVSSFVVSQVVAAALHYLVNKQTPQGQLHASLSLHPRSERPTFWGDLLTANDYAQSYGVYGFAPLALMDVISRSVLHRFAPRKNSVATLRHVYPWLRLPAYGLRYGMFGTSVLGAAAEGVELYRWKAGAMRNALRSAYSREPQNWADAITTLEKTGLPTLSALNTLGFALKVNEGLAPVATLLTPATMLGKGGLALWSGVTAPFHWLYLGFLPKMVEWSAAKVANGLAGTAGFTGGTIGAVVKNIPSATLLYMENMLAGAVSKARGEKAISLSSHVLGATLTGLSWGSSIPLSRTFSRHAPSATKHLALLSPFLTAALWQLSPALLAQVPDLSDTRAVERLNDLTSWLAKRYDDELRYLGF